MLDHDLVHAAVRAQLLTLAVCSSSTGNLSATSTGYARGAGSFVTDGFLVGQEVAASGFTNSNNNGVGVITNVTALALTVTKTPATTTEASGGGRALSVGLPAAIRYENVTRGKKSVQDQLTVEEAYLPGPMTLATVGPSGTVIGRPTYVVKYYLPQNGGIACARSYTKATLALFPMGQPFNLSNGDTVRVRGDTGPSADQLRPDDPGWVVLTLTIPLRIYSINAR